MLDPESWQYDAAAAASMYAMRVCLEYQIELEESMYICINVVVKHESRSIFVTDDIAFAAAAAEISLI